MSSKATTEKRDDARRGPRWQAPTELSPSVVREAEPFWVRMAGALGLAFLVFGGVALTVHQLGRSSWVGPTWAGLTCVAGLGLLLLHAASDADLQIRRAYMVLGFAGLLAGAVATLLPYQGPVGHWFLPHGAVGLSLGLLFLMAFLRNETDEDVRSRALYVVGGLGAAMAVAGFVLGSVKPEFLFSPAVLLAVLGLVFLWVFVGQRGVTDDHGYYAALGVGVLGAAAAVIALGRSVPEWLAGRGWVSTAAPYFMPNGLVLTACGLLYVALAVGLVSEKPFVVMTRRQLASYFHSPIAYFVILLFAVVACFQFGQFVLERLWDPFTNRPSQGVPEPIIRPYFLNLVSIFSLVFIVPVLTMSLLSEEKRTGTLEMTLTAPQEELTVVLSKFVAALLLFVLTWAPWGLFLIALRVSGGQPFDYQPFLAWTIVLVFTGAGFVGMGLFFSSLTKNQLTAAVLTFVGMLLLVGLFLLKETALTQGSLWHKVFSRVSFIDIWWESLDGRLAVSQLFYHASVAVFWLFLTVKVLESRKWR